MSNIVLRQRFFLKGLATTNIVAIFREGNEYIGWAGAAAALIFSCLVQSPDSQIWHP